MCVQMCVLICVCVCARAQRRWQRVKELVVQLGGINEHVSPLLFVKATFAD